MSLLSHLAIHYTYWFGLTLGEPLICSTSISVIYHQPSINFFVMTGFRALSLHFMLFYLQYLKKAVCIKPKYWITLDYIGQLVSFLSPFILLYFLLPYRRIISVATGISYKIRQHLSCRTDFVIYCAFCKKCNRQCVGSAIDFRHRLSNYKSHIKKQKQTCRLVNHFIDNSSDHSLDCLKFTLIEQISNKTERSGGTRGLLASTTLDLRAFWF